MEERKSTERLTQREREALRGWLQHKTAKEIALDIGVSHYAVEKRLKTARLKLGVSSSLEAARALADEEGYGQTVARPADLPATEALRNKWPTKSQILGVAAMFSFAAVILVFALQTEPEARGTIEREMHADPATGEGTWFVSASSERVEAYVRREFETWDRDRSGFIELIEAPARVFGTNSGQIEGERARAHFVANVDRDGDGRVSYEEFADAPRRQFLESGIPLIPADLIRVHANMVEPAENTLIPALSRGRVMPTPIEMRLMASTSFAVLDADGSGFMESIEGPVSTPQEPVPVLDYDESGRLVDTGKRIARTVEELRDRFYQNADKDDDARVSRAEYEIWAIENYRATGITPESQQTMNGAIGPQT